MFSFLGVASPPLATLTWMVKRLEDCFEHEGFLVYLFGTTTSRLGSTVWESGKPLKFAPYTPPYPGVWIRVSENNPSRQLVNRGNGVAPKCSTAKTTTVDPRDSHGD